MRSGKGAVSCERARGARFAQLVTAALLTGAGALGGAA
jgi:hypothetical protein